MRPWPGSRAAPLRSRQVRHGRADRAVHRRPDGERPRGDAPSVIAWRRSSRSGKRCADRWTPLSGRRCASRAPEPARLTCSPKGRRCPAPLFEAAVSKISGHIAPPTRRVARPPRGCAVAGLCRHSGGMLRRGRPAILFPASAVRPEQAARSPEQDRRHQQVITSSRSCRQPHPPRMGRGTAEQIGQQDAPEGIRDADQQRADQRALIEPSPPITMTTNARIRISSPMPTWTAESSRPCRRRARRGRRRARTPR